MRREWAASYRREQKVALRAELAEHLAAQAEVEINVNFLDLAVAEWHKERLRQEVAEVRLAHETDGDWDWPWP
jgi:hypothetical protein